MLHAQMQWLPAEPGVRKDAVVADRLLVRIQPWVPRYLHGEILERVGLKIHHAILPYEQSLTADRDKAGDNLLNVNRAIALEEPLLRSYVVEFDAEHATGEDDLHGTSSYAQTLKFARPLLFQCLPANRTIRRSISKICCER